MDQALAGNVVELEAVGSLFTNPICKIPGGRTTHLVCDVWTEAVGWTRALKPAIHCSLGR